MALILAIQPDERQAAILSGVVMNQLRADLVLVDSKDAALACIRKRVPDLILLAAELGRPDDEEFASKLRKIKNAEHLRTLSMPPLGSSEEDEGHSGGGLLKAFKRKRVDERRRGRDPKLFTKELRSYLKRAERIKADLRSVAGTPAPALEQTPEPEAERPAAAAAATPASQPPRPAPGVAPEPAGSAPGAAHASTRSGRLGLAEGKASAPAPVTTFESIEARVAMSMRVIDAAGARPDGDAEAIIRALRVPSSVAAFAYPRGCRIGHIRLARPSRPRAMRRPVLDPPPAGPAATNYQAAV